MADAERIAADEVETKFQPNDLFADGTMLGPLSSAAQVQRVTGWASRRASTRAPSWSPAA